jgi:hypothetical protein
VLRDLFLGGLGKTNGKIISLLDSLNTCHSFRVQAPHHWQHVQEESPRRTRQSLYYAGGQLARCASARSRNETLRRVSLVLWIIINNLLVKFGPATLVSLAVGETPVVLKGPRHLVSFGLALALVQMSPADLAFRALSLGPVQALLGAGVALYKLRKAIFVVHAVHAADGSHSSLLHGAVLMWLVLDGTSNARTHRLPHSAMRDSRTLRMRTTLPVPCACTHRACGR